ncbi:MAG: hypothetical protein A2Y36_09150 [Treponema sp. GWA1_62_8]|nr:MAG: hypothetical protein A2Y36_09150 [Treponema sp. GWA1_62_8]
MVGAPGGVTINWKGCADTLLETDPPVVQRFDAPSPYAVVDELESKLADFRKAYRAGSLTAEDFEGFGPVVRFRSSFEGAWRKTLDYIQKRRKEL